MDFQTRIKMSRPITFFFTCPNCEHEQEVGMWPIIPARTYGPPEMCSPEEGGEVENGTCEQCGHEFAEDAVREKGMNIANERREAAEEDRAESRQLDREAGI